MTDEDKQAQPATEAPGSYAQALDIQGFSYEDRRDVLPLLSAGLTNCGGWVMDRRTLSPASLEFHLEIELRSVVDLYATLLAAGLELTRSGHAALTELCLCRKHMAVSAGLGKAVAVRLEVSFLSDAGTAAARSGWPHIA